MKGSASLNDHRTPGLYIDDFGCEVCHENVSLVGVAIRDKDLKLQGGHGQLDRIVILDSCRHVGDDGCFMAVVVRGVMDIQLRYVVLGETGEVLVCRMKS